MNKKYEFVEGDTIVIAPGRTVKRIRALVAIAAVAWLPPVNPGDLGGYVESEANLRVSGNAWVYGNALVSGNAQVSGDAQVSGNAWVPGDGLICWFSHVGTESGTLTVYNGRDNTLLCTRGCFSGTVDEFLTKSAAVHGDRIRHEYKLLIEVARSRIESARAEIAEPDEAQEAA